LQKQEKIMARRKLVSGAYFAAATALLALALQGSALATWTPVPELDPGTTMAGLGVLAGSAALLIERYRRQKR
jgi:hypothetical protein